jgi:hypothetical protein
MLDDIFAVIVFGFLYVIIFSGLVIATWTGIKLKNDKTVLLAEFVLIIALLISIAILTFGFIEYINWSK